MLKMIYSKALLLSLAMALTVLSACQAKDSQEPVSTALVIGAHANSKQLNFSNKQITDAVNQAIGTYGLVSVVCADGSPDLVLSNLYDIPDAYKSASPQKLKMDAAKKASALLGGLASIKADDEEVDLLESLRLAARSLKNAPSGSQLLIIAVDSGLSTTGLLSFNDGFAWEDPGYVAESLYEISAIPDFSGITVSWHQIGDTALPQEQLTPEQRIHVTSVWRSIVEKTGGIFEASDVISNPGDIDPAGMPHVSAIKLEAPATAEPVLPEEFTGESDLVLLTEEQIAFRPNTAVFLDESGALSTLAPIAQMMLDHPGFSALLVGATAGGDSTERSLKLSADRANAVKDALVSLGVPDSRIETLGMGSADPWHIPDRDSDGNFIEDIARQNRKVVLLDADSEMAGAIQGN
ncbi:MAG: OmpA family protein [Clostridiales bacterium]|nr:OmpA family protein [Clostridiales bacterium]